MSFDPVDFLETAVRTPSHEDATGMRELLVETVEAASADVSVAVDDAGNALAVREADRAGPHVVLNTHVDTVPPHVEFEREGDVIRGRGSCDAKGPLAAMLAAFLGAEVDRGRVTLAVTPDEETASTGAAALDFDARDDLGPVPDAVVVGEPTELDVCTAAKGRFQAAVTVGGANAHAAEPEAGVNAVRAAADALAALDSFDDRPDAPDPSDALGAPTLVPTTVEGGTATNQVPADCSFVVDRRTVPPETADGFRAALADHLAERTPSEATVDVRLAERETPFLRAFETPEDADVVGALRAAGAGRVRPFGAATEASYFAQVAPTVVFGPGALADDEGAVAHAPREYVRVPQVERAAGMLADALAALCG
ncbi:M20/M25/M40 family metallo-hydrolase [Halorussus halobius]|uniref:M20/M25/M40 family metallo-hydrolase n=1 Tax=Halorussus halobius TaxID=1710537 RepID=UPI001092387E|nr:M20/M25/M40 family metallo-hydrolase [Halorussus halobius]